MCLPSILDNRAADSGADRTAAAGIDGGNVTRLVLAGGHVLDPALGIDEQLDVVIEDGRIVDLAAAGSVGAGEDVAGLLVVPGLIDLHGHWWEGSPYGIDPRINLRGGVTTVVDAGTSGFSTFDVFRRLTVETAPLRVLAYLHVAAGGLVSTVAGELEDMRYARPRETAAVIREHRDILAGVKVRIGTGACGLNSTAALDAALEAAELADVPLMAHIAEGADVEAVARRLRAGDVITHALTASGPGILGADGHVLGTVLEARRRGVTLDVGHGCGSFSWTTARRAHADRVTADTISTDLHRYSVERPVVDLPLTMSKLLHLGMPLANVVTAATSRPAAILGRADLGSLRPGGPADVAVLRLDRHPVSLSDSLGIVETVDTVLRPVLTVASGVVHRAADVAVALRPYLEADREVDCAVPI
jgi:dihydroorotase